MAIKQEHIVGFAVGVGAAAAGYYLYRKNQAQVDQFLKEHGIDMPSPAVVDAESLTLEQLVSEKERLEDLIAEREMAAPAAESTAPAEPARKTPKRKRAKRKKAS
jgi:hypothetical protein